MAVMDEFKEQREAIKEKSFREKLKYFVYYYKWHVLGGLAIVLLLTALVRDMLNSKEMAMFGLFLNAYSTTLESPDEFVEDFAAYADIDLNENSLSFEHTFRMGEQMDQAGLEANQMIMVYLAAGDLDVMTMDEYNFNKYAYKDVYSNLRTLLSEEMLEQYKDYLFYIDNAFMEEVDRVAKEETLDYVITYPDYTDPDSMEDPIPVGINLTVSEKYHEYYSYGDDEGFIGILINTKNADKCKKIFEFLFPTE